jgi:hypothetical protein
MPNDVRSDRRYQRNTGKPAASQRSNQFGFGR